MATCKPWREGDELKLGPSPHLPLLSLPAITATHWAPVGQADAREDGAEAATAQLRAQLVQIL